MLETIHPFAIAFTIGLLIGVDRERSHPEGSQAMGVRTFVLIGLLGTLAAQAASPVVTVGITTVVFSLIALGYLRSTRKENSPADIGLTTELSAIVVFALGYLAFTERGLASILGVVALLIVRSRQWIHGFVRNTLLPGEINAAVTLLVAALVVVPFLPNRTVDPWGLLNPSRLALLASVIAGMQFAGYAAQRLLGPERGLMLSGFFGGLVSSTAVFATLSTRLKSSPEGERAASASAILATVATLVELLVILFSASALLGKALVVPVVAMMVTGAVMAWLIARRSSWTGSAAPPSNPLDAKAILKLSLVIGGMLFLVGAAQRTLGAEAVGLVTFLGGLFEIHGVSLASATLHFQEKITLNEASLSVGTAVLASFVSKWALLWGLSTKSFARQVSLALLGMLTMGVIAYLALPLID